MSMSANFHETKTIELTTLVMSQPYQSHPTLMLHDNSGCYVCHHLTDKNVEQLEAAIASYRETHPRVEQAEAA